MHPFPVTPAWLAQLMQVALMLSIVFSIIIGTLTFLSKHLQPGLARYWIAFNVFVAGWAFLWWLGGFVFNGAVAWRCLVVAPLVAMVLPPIYLQFVSHYLEKKSGRFSAEWFAWVVSAILWVLCACYPTLLIKAIDEVHVPHRQIGGPLLFVFALQYGSITLLGFYWLWRAAQRQSVARRNQTLYILAGTGIGIFGGGITFLPVMGVPILPIGVLVIPAYPLFITYAILKHGLLSLRVVLQTTIVYSMVTTILAATYIISIAVITHLLAGWFPMPGSISTIASTGMVALLFHPLQIRIQHWIDRRFPRESLDQNFLRESTGRFIHEIKRPLAKISMPVQLALGDLEQLSSSADKDKVAQIKSRLEFVLKEVLSTADRIEALRHISARATAREPVDIIPLLKNVLRSYEQELQTHKITIKTDFSKEPFLILGQVSPLEIVFSNLIKNAIEALAESENQKTKIIELSTSVHAANGLIVIKDNGPGIAVESRAHIFDPYWTNKRDQGTGLGLYLVDQIMRQHHGSVEVQSDSGATFILRFPMRD
jgi:signal transduction histidine kinase